LPADSFADPVWNALHSTHRQLAVVKGLAFKYARDVTPFAGLAENTAAAMGDLCYLLEPGEVTYVIGAKPPAVEEVRVELGPLCLQMAFPPEAPPPEVSSDIATLTCADAEAMVGLTDVAFPGFFRARTCLMGSYFGIWEGDKLVAMAGERLCPQPFREVSGVCTHPDFRGRGYAAGLIGRVIAEQRRLGALSALHVASVNHRAIEIYLRLGFEKLREVQLHKVTRILGS
jgi:ribosomal protein S18 acetylase RimI-like enzyme